MDLHSPYLGSRLESIWEGIQNNEMDNIPVDKNQPQWFVMNIYAKHNRKAEEVLSSSQGLPHFIPKHYVVRKYFGKVRRELVPLIHNLVFVHASYTEVHNFQRQYAFLGFAVERHGDHYSPLVVPDYQMENFIRIASHHDQQLLYFRPEEIALAKGVFVRILGGPYHGAKGEMMRIKGKRDKRLVVRIPQIMAVAATTIEPELIQVISEEEFRQSEPLTDWPATSDPSDNIHKNI